MTDAAENKTPPVPQVDQFPDRTFPVVFADGAWSVAYGSGHVKFYLFRNDPSIPGDGSTRPMPFVQVVMPFIGFVTMTVFFRVQMEIMKNAGLITQETINAAEALFTKPPATPT